MLILSSGLCERNVGRSDDGLHRLGVGELPGDVGSIMRLGVDEALEILACPYGGLLGIGVARPDINLDLEGGGETITLNKAITVFTTRARDSPVASMRSSH